MRLIELEKYKALYPQIESFIPEFERYILSLASKKTDFDIVPLTVAHRIHSSEVIAILLLSFLDNEGLIRSTYQVICKLHDTFLQEFNSKEEIPTTIFCPYDNDTHDEDHYFVQLVFKFTELFVDKYSKIPVGSITYD